MQQTYNLTVYVTTFQKDKAVPAERSSLSAPRGWRRAVHTRHARSQDGLNIYLHWQTLLAPHQTSVIITRTEDVKAEMCCSLPEGVRGRVHGVGGVGGVRGSMGVGSDPLFRTEELRALWSGGGRGGGCVCHLPWEEEEEEEEENYRFTQITP